MAILAIDCENGCYQLVFSVHVWSSKRSPASCVSKIVCHNVSAAVVGQCRAVVRHPVLISIRLLACLSLMCLSLHSCRISLNCWNYFSVTMRFSRTIGKYCCSFKYLVFLNLVLFYVSSLFDARRSKPSKIKISQ